MNLIEAVLLGILQGLTEFLPISSSGHLVLAGSALGTKMPGALFEVAVHAGTLLAILLYYRRDLLRMVGSVLRLRRDEESRLFLLILLASIPAAAVGLLFAKDLEALFDRPLLAGCMLIVTGLVLVSTRFAKGGQGDVGPFSAIAIGVGQAFAILPGISRSGTTIATGMHAGVSPRSAARFSFLLAIPALVGAAALKGADLAAHPPDSAITLACGVGALAAFLSGYAALRMLLAIVSRGRLDRFAWYCFALGCAAVIHFL